MVKFFQHTQVYEHPWEKVTLAYWNKYSPQNPYVSHIKGYDTLERNYDQSNSVLTSTRIILKKGMLPKWGQSFMKKPEAYVLEDSEINSQTKTMTAVTRNVNYTKVMYVVETLTLKPHPENENWTVVVSSAHIVSSLGWGLKSRVESFGLNRFIKAAQRSREAMKFSIEKLGIFVSNTRLSQNSHI